MLHDVVHRLRLLVEGGHRRADDGAHFRHGGHVAQVDQVQRGFARQQDQAAALFEHYVGRAGEQVVGQAVGDGCQRAHGAGCHHHATGAKRAAGDAGTDVVDAVHHVGQGGCVRAL